MGRSARLDLVIYAVDLVVLLMEALRECASGDE